MICYHHNDLDGRCAAAIAKKAWDLQKIPKRPHMDDTNLRFREIDYKDDPYFGKEVEKGERVIIVDFSFNPEKMYQLRLVTDVTNITWIDHHETAKAYNYGTELAGLRDFSTECKISGCELTWKYFFPETDVPFAVELIGDYDTWTFKYGDNTSTFQLGMRASITDPSSLEGATLWENVFKGQYLDRITLDGIAIRNFRDQFCSGYRKSFGFETSFEGYNCYALNLHHLGSQSFANENESHDLVIAFAWDGSIWTVSMYSETVDVGKIAVKYNGGGHKKAAGFVCKELPFKKEM